MWKGVLLQKKFEKHLKVCIGINLYKCKHCDATFDTDVILQ